MDLIESGVARFGSTDGRDGSTDGGDGGIDVRVGGIEEQFLAGDPFVVIELQF